MRIENMAVLGDEERGRPLQCAPPRGHGRGGYLQASMPKSLHTEGELPGVMGGKM